jgi:DNA-binding MarR family transcriptional regulator
LQSATDPPTAKEANVSTHSPEGLDRRLAAELTHELGRHARLLHAMKGAMAAFVPADLDLAAIPLLFALVREGPRRQGELAEMSFLDPSTVSRHVAQLAKAGYVQRRPHPQDGRAVQLVATDEGERVVEEVSCRRQDLMVAALGHWEPGDVETLVRLLSRFNDDLEAIRPQPGRPSEGSPPARGPDPHSAPLPDPRTPDQENA